MSLVFNPFTGTFDFVGAGGSSSGIGGTIANTQIAFGTGVDTIGGSANLTWTGSSLTVLTTEYSFSVNPTSISLLHTPTNAEIEMDTNGGIEITPATGERLSVNGDVLLGGNTVIDTGKTIRVSQGAAATALFQAYDVDGTAYKTFGTGTSGNTPSWDWSFPSGGTLTGNFTSLQVNGVPVGTGLSGTIAATQVAFGTGADTIGGDADLTYISGTGQLINAGPLRIGAAEDPTAQIELQGTTVASTTYNVALAANMTVTSATDDVTAVLQAYYLDARVNVEHNSGTTSGHDFTNYVHVAAGKSTTGYVGEYFGQVFTGPGTIDLHQGASFESNYNATQVGPAMSINFEAPNLSAGAALTSTFYYLNMSNLSATTTGGAKGAINYGAGKFVVDSAGAVTGAGVSLTDTELLAWMGL